VLGDGDTAAKSRDLAVCLLVVDGLPHERIWRHWAQRCEAEAGIRIKFYAHAHKPEKVESPWLREALIDEHFETKWGSVELARAAAALFRAAVRDRSFDAEFAALASETCLPVAAPLELEAALFLSTSPVKSWVAAFDEPDNGYAVDAQWRKVHKALPAACVWKAPQWLLLTRAHARLLSKAVDVEVKRAGDGRKGRETWRLFANVTAADELFFPSVLALCAELRRTGDDRVEAPRIHRRRLTWCDWSAGGRSPATLPHLTPALVARARAEGCLFARKFPPDALQDPAHWDRLLAAAAAESGRQTAAPGDAAVAAPSSSPPAAPTTTDER